MAITPQDLVRKGRYQGEAYKIINRSPHEAIGIIATLLEDAGWEPDMTTVDGWLPRKTQDSSTTDSN